MAFISAVSSMNYGNQSEKKFRLKKVKSSKTHFINQQKQKKHLKFIIRPPKCLRLNLTYSTLVKL